MPSGLIDTMKEPIALVGIGCRFPQAANPDEFWKLLMGSGDAIHAYREHRIAALDAYYAASKKTRGGVPVHLGGFLKDIDRFDEQFFELAPREAMYMDPQHRLLMEVAWEALEDAGQTREMYFGSRTGVYVGISTNDYEKALSEDLPELDFYVMMGGGRCAAAGRLSFFLGLEGPSMIVDTACSSSLVAIDLACKALQKGEINMGLAGGVHLRIDTSSSQMFAEAGMLASDGHCKFGDASADGFVRSEGCGIVVLKRLSDAIAANDPIYAVIRGTAVTNDGKTNGLLATPSQEGQLKMLRQAWSDAEIEPAQLRYVEAHGTGTSVGDPVEMGALGQALAEANVFHTCPVGSVKTNIGHAEAASGVAGLIKTALSLRHRTVPPSLHQHHPNPNIPWDTLPIKVLNKPLVFPEEAGALLAGINSFGLSGTNAHVVLEEYRSDTAPVEENPAPQLFVLSAHTSGALKQRAADTARLLSDTVPFPALQDLCYTAARRRTAQDHRLAIVANDIADLEKKLLSVQSEQTEEGVTIGRKQSTKHRVVFVAPGQGSQWNGMCRELYEADPVFRESLRRCDAAIQKETEWSLLDRLMGEKAAAYLQEIDFVQPALFAVSVSLAAMWRAWGVEPDAITGHSMGEVAAAHIAGALTLQDAAAVICRRSRLMRTLSGSGSMATVELPWQEVQPYIHGMQGRVSIAAINSPATTVISGDPEQVDALLQLFELKDVFCRRIKVDVASHSSQVDPILEALAKELVHLQPEEASIPIFSTVTGASITGSEMNAGYWVKNLREPVLLAKALDTLYEDGHNVFIELSPHPILIPAMEATLQDKEQPALLVSSLRREKPERASMLAGLGSLFAGGYPVRFELLYSQGRCVPLPVYPFQRERHWPEELLAQGEKQGARANRMNPFLGARIESAIHYGTTLWEADFSLSRFPYLKDHKVRDLIVLPASAHMETALEAARSLHPDADFDVVDMTFQNALYLEENGRQQFQVAVTTRDTDRYSFEIRSRENDEQDGTWTLHSSGKLEKSDPCSQVTVASIGDTEQEAAVHATAADFYRDMTARSLNYGPAFQLIDEAWCTEKTILGRIHSLPLTGKAAESYRIHPAILDACAQTLIRIGLLAESGRPQDTYMPVKIGRLRVLEDVPQNEELLVYGICTQHADSLETLDFDLRITDQGGKTLAEAQGVRIQKLVKPRQDDVTDMLFGFEWLAVEGEPVSQSSKTDGERWLVFGTKDDRREKLVAALSRREIPYTIVEPAADLRFTEQVNSLLADSGGKAFSNIVYLCPRDVRDAESAPSISRGMEVARLVQAVSGLEPLESARLWLISSGAFVVDGSPCLPDLGASTMWGMGLVVDREQPELHSSMVDLSAAPDSVEMESLVAFVLSGEVPETRNALRGQKRYVARLVTTADQDIAAAPAPLQPDEEYLLEISETGIFDNLALRAVGRTAPGPDEVAIEVRAASLNFIDVAKALGVYPDLDPTVPLWFGNDCSGVVVAVGRDVTAFEAGDEVVAVSLEQTGTMRSYLLASQLLVAPKPAHLSFEQAATLPIAYITAYLSLVKLANVKAGEWVLIPSATGGVGLAAIEICKRAGAHVIATASSAEKQEYLRGLGVHVLPSRSLAFAEQVMEITQGRGVDIVLNSLRGEFITRSLEILAPFGRFIELGKRDIYEDRRIGLKVFRNNNSYHAVDLIGAWVQGMRSEISEILRHSIDQVAQGKWRTLPVTQFSAADPVEPFRYMATSKHIGKIAITMDRDVKVLPRKDRSLFKHDATYLVVGGFGGVGSATAEWMAANGAGHIVIVSRRAPSDDSRRLLEHLAFLGASATHAQIDVANRAEVDTLLNRLRDTSPPVRGVMQAATVIDDALIKDLTPEKYDPLFAGKVEGSWNLHCATLDLSLDFFVLFSSAASIYTQPGMGAYAAANAFLDALAYYRQGRGLAASSVNWGGWDEVGLAREAGTRRSIEGFVSEGILSFTKQEGLAAMGKVIERNAVQTVVFHFSPDVFVNAHAHSGIPFLFREIARGANRSQADAGARSQIRESLAATESSAERKELLETYLQEQLSHVLRCAPERIDRERTFGTLGVDSLMALEFARRINGGLSVSFPATVVFNYPTIKQLSQHALSKMGMGAATAAGSTTSQKNPPVAAVVEEELSDEEALQALMQPGGQSA